MSILFDTLEKIRKNETAPTRAAQAVAKNSAQPAQKPKRKPVIIVCFLIAVAYGIYLSLPLLFQPEPAPIQENIAKQASSEEQPAAAIVDVSPEVSSTEEPVPSSGPENNVLVQLNNDGVALIEEEDYSTGIRSFRQAMMIAPEQIEPVINIAVAHAETGQYSEALHFFEQAYALDPIHPALVENLYLLNRAGLLTSKVIDRQEIEAFFGDIDELEPGEDN